MHNMQDFHRRKGYGILTCFAGSCTAGCCTRALAALVGGIVAVGSPSCNSKETNEWPGHVCDTSRSAIDAGHKEKNRAAICILMVCSLRLCAVQQQHVIKTKL